MGGEFLLPRPRPWHHSSPLYFCSAPFAPLGLGSGGLRPPTPDPSKAEGTAPLCGRGGPRQSLGPGPGPGPGPGGRRGAGGQRPSADEWIDVEADGDGYAFLFLFLKKEAAKNKKTPKSLIERMKK
jgi:hypothetical protein